MEMFSNSARRESQSHFRHWIAFAYSPLLLCVRLQEVNATPVRFISDLLVEDTWSHVFMDTLAPRGFVKVRHDRGGERSSINRPAVYPNMSNHVLRALFKNACMVSLWRCVNTVKY